MCTDKRPAQPICKTVRSLATLSEAGDDPDPVAALDPSATALGPAGEPTSAPGSPWVGGGTGESSAEPASDAGRDRPVPDPGAARRRRHGRRLPRRADRAGRRERRAEDHQARHGHRRRSSPASSAERQRPGAAWITRTSPGCSTPAPPPTAGRISSWSWSRRRRSRATATTHRLTSDAAAGALRAGLPGGAARPPEGRHPPRPQAVERPRRAGRRPAGAEGDRLRHRQGDRRQPADRSDARTRG